MTLAQKVVAAFAAGVLVLAVGALSLLTVARLLGATRTVEQAGQNILRLERVRSALTDAETGQRGYVITGDSQYLDPYRAARAAIDSETAALRAVDARDPVRRGWLDSLDRRVVEKFDELNETIALRDRSGVAAATAVVRTNRGRKAMDDARRLVRLLEDRERRIALALSDARQRAARAALWVIGLGTAVAVVLIVLVNQTIRAGVAQEIRAREQLEDRSRELAEHVEEAQALAEELEASNTQLQEMSTEAEAERDAAEEAREHIGSILGSMPDAVSGFDRDWRWTYVNSGAEAVLRKLGVDPTAIIGRNVWEVPALLGPSFETNARAAARQRETIEYEEYLAPVDCWFANRIVPVRDGVVVFSLDVTERHRRRDAERFFGDVDAFLARAPLDYEAALIGLAGKTIPFLADYCGIDVTDESGAIRRVAAAHADPAKEPTLREMWARYPFEPGASYGAPAVLRSGTPELAREMTAEQIEAFATDADHLAMLRILGPRSYVCVPMRTGERILGAISLVFAESGRRYDESRLAWAEEVARRAGAAVERARLHRDATESARRLGYLAKASAVLSASLDYEATLSSLASLVVPELADWCAVAVRREDGTVHQVAVAHVDPGKVAWARQLNERYPPDPDAPTGVPGVLRTGEPQFVPVVTDDMLAAAAVDAEHLRILREVGLTGAIIVPVSGRGRTLGAITLVSAESGKRYTREDLILAEELGRRAGIAIDNARLFRDAQGARAEADDARAVALSASEAKSDFLAAMSHEIRTPINAILGYTELLALEISGPLTDEQRVQLERIRSSTRHLLVLVSDVLDLAKVEAGTLRVEQREALAGDSCDAAMALIRPQATAKGVTLSARCEGARDAIYLGDDDRVRQILANLLANALKFTDPGGSIVVECVSAAVPPASVRLCPDERYVALRVVDTGIGIAAGQLEAIFEPFVQAADAARSAYVRERSGAGLGLAISRQLAHLMHGEITVESVVGRGSTFTLWLPAGESPRG